VQIKFHILIARIVAEVNAAKDNRGWSEYMYSVVSIPRIWLFLSDDIGPCAGADIDECATNDGGCDNVADCTNTDGGFYCTCHVGYAGDGFTCSGSRF